jgi:hypothetical protein
MLCKACTVPASVADMPPLLIGANHETTLVWKYDRFRISPNSDEIKHKLKSGMARLLCKVLLGHRRAEMKSQNLTLCAHC